MLSIVCFAAALAGVGACFVYVLVKGMREARRLEALEVARGRLLEPVDQAGLWTTGGWLHCLDCDQDAAVIITKKSERFLFNGSKRSTTRELAFACLRCGFASEAWDPAGHQAPQYKPGNQVPLALFLGRLGDPGARQATREALEEERLRLLERSAAVEEGLASCAGYRDNARSA